MINFWRKKKMKKTIFKYVAFLCAILVASCLVSCFGFVKKGPDLEAIYDEYCSPSWADLGSDGSYLFVDTNPYDEDDGDYTYMFVVNNAIEDINEALGLPESLNNDMDQTTWSMGKQKETFEDIGIDVSWTYHPDKGLEVTYKLIR